MKWLLILCAILCVSPLELDAQEKGDIMVGMNLASAPYRIVEPSFEFFTFNSFSIEASGGYCLNRPSKTMHNVTEYVLGGFANLTARLYFFDKDNIRSFFGFGWYYGNFQRKAEVNLPHYYGTYSSLEVIKHEKMGWNMILGLHYRPHHRVVIQPSVKFTVIGSRDDQYPFDYWTPGVGRAGLSESYVRPKNFSFLPLLQIKIAI